MRRFNMKLAPGTRFGAYEVVAWLGAGGMGEVYRARHTDERRPLRCSGRLFVPTRLLRELSC